jgi:hypothetical protein
MSMRCVALSSMVLLIAALSIVPVVAQDAAPVRLRGTVSAVTGDQMTIATREGGSAIVTLAADAGLSAVQPVPLWAIKPGSFIGTAAAPDHDGVLTALEVVVFPDAMRGTGEGHYDWDLRPGSSMTNGTVDAVVEANSGKELRLSFRGGSIKVQVPPNIPVVTIQPANRGDLTSGAAVFVVAQSRGGGLEASRVVIGRNGVVPPM